MSPPSNLVEAVLLHLGVNYELVETIPYKDTKTEKFLKLNPYGQVPVIEHGDFILNESKAIARYIARISGDKTFYPHQDFKKVSKLDAL
eukprot:CAMPEP_0168343454 /NCGR_PEP_ID=MMETSP0213-20121227/16103_1 /TAXON_ID=151035 /ORGANISM="Euplotes harpa, Strain FSP1.4" /LENGTH=88 /DNA_ID=CAMNT_0008350753 /DNA_START=55 /DNA_END=318 /DNA_ORIENTATION=+